MLTPLSIDSRTMRWLQILSAKYGIDEMAIVEIALANAFAQYAGDDELGVAVRAFACAPFDARGADS